MHIWLLHESITVHTTQEWLSRSQCFWYESIHYFIVLFLYQLKAIELNKLFGYSSQSLPRNWEMEMTIESWRRFTRLILDEANLCLIKKVHGNFHMFFMCLGGKLCGNLFNQKVVDPPHMPLLSALNQSNKSKVFLLFFCIIYGERTRTGNNQNARQRSSFMN